MIFLYANLIDKIFITVEPIYFKTGIPAFSYINFHDIIPFFIERAFLIIKKLSMKKELF